MNSFVSLPLVVVMLSGVALAFLALAYKMAAVSNCRPMAFASVFLLTATLLSGWRVCFEATAWGDWRLWALGFAMGANLYINLGLVVVVNQLGPASVSWTILNLSVLVPLLLAQLFLDEPFLKVDGLLVTLFILMLLALRRGIAQGHDPVRGSPLRFWTLLLVVFLLNGLFQFGSKLKDTFFNDGSAAGLATLFYGSGMVLALATHAARTRGGRFTRDEWLCGGMAGMCSGLGMLLLLHGMSLPAVVAFPVSLGIALIGGVALTAILYRERLNTGKVVGWVLGLILIVLAVTRERANAFLGAL